ncbi:MAG: aldo/keto reductase [Planctomycetes bacterium]|nr:aldo/keto reductase [Planctomycetota bacterium]
MEYRLLGRTGLRVSVLGFGAGPVSGLMTSANVATQRECVDMALERGVNWFDTAPGYGDGESERRLGDALRGRANRETLHLATKVRLSERDLDDPYDAIERSLQASLLRLGAEQVSLLQLHNGITARRNDIAASISTADLLCRGGIADAMERLRSEKRVRFVGLTGTGSAAALREALNSDRFDTLQIPFNVLNPTAECAAPPNFSETDYGRLFGDCERLRIGVFAIRVFAGGAMLGRDPSTHTLTTKFFPLDLYQRDLRRAARLERELPHGIGLHEAAVRFSITPPAVSCALIGLGAASEVEAAEAAALKGPLARPLFERFAEIGMASPIADRAAPE